MHASLEALKCSVGSDFSSFGAFTGSRHTVVVVFPCQRELWPSELDGLHLQSWNSLQDVPWSPANHPRFWFDWSALCYWMTLAWGRLNLLVVMQLLRVTAELWSQPFNQPHKWMMNEFRGLFAAAFRQNNLRTPQETQKKAALVKTSVRSVDHL